MKQVKITKNVAELIEVPKPEEVPADHVLVQVSFAAFNGIDKVRADNGSTAPPGIEFSGRVHQLGNKVTDLQTGERVIGLSNGAALSEYVVVPRATLIRTPEWLDDETASSVLQMLTIGWDAVTQINLHAGQTAVVRGANTIIGYAISQLLQHRKCRVLEIVRTLRTEHNQSALQVTHAPSEWSEAADAVFECVGAKYIDEDISLLKSEGKLLLLGGMGPSEVKINVLPAMMKRISIIGSTFSSRDVTNKSNVMNEVEQTVLPMLQTGILNPPTIHAFSSDKVAAGYAKLLEGTGGKVVINLTS